MIFSSERNGTTNEVILTGIKRDLEGYGHNLRGETYILIDYNEDSGVNGAISPTFGNASQTEHRPQ
jgi:hypothetical protein